jgi:glycerophosphoryl diester phosphodiesterase
VVAGSNVNARIAIIGLAIMLAAVVFVTWDQIQLATGWALPQRTGPALLIVSHHGDLDAYPENTAESLWAAAALEPDGIEIDVHRSASGTWYVIHDPTLDRTTDGRGRISTLTDEVIDAATVDAGLGFKPGLNAEFHVPRLNAVLAGLAAFRGTIYLDVQHAEGGDPATLLDLTDGMTVAIICRSAVDAAAVNARDPRVETLLGVGAETSADVDGLIGDAIFDASPRRVAALTRPVTVYVAEDQFGKDEYPLLRLAWASGVKAFITNHLAAALAARDALASGQP